MRRAMLTQQTTKRQRIAGPWIVGGRDAHWIDLHQVLGGSCIFSPWGKKAHPKDEHSWLVNILYYYNAFLGFVVTRIAPPDSSSNSSFERCLECSSGLV